MYNKKAMNELRPLFTCTLCQQMFADPVRLKLCGHTFCHFCLVKHFQKSKFCAQCSRTLDDISPKAYSSDLGLQELAYRCFPEETVTAMRRKFDLIRDESSLVHQVCSVNLVYLLQHHVSSSSGKIRVKVRLNKNRTASGKNCADHQNDKMEMILHCEYDIQVGSIKKLFAQKYQLPASSINLFTSNLLSLSDKDTIGEVVLYSGNFDGVTPIVMLAHIIDKETDDVPPQIDDDMPVLEAETYESEPPSLTPFLLNPELPSLSADETTTPIVSFVDEHSQSLPELPRLCSTTQSKMQVTSQKSTAKRRSMSDIEKPSKMKKAQSKSEAKTVPQPSTSNLMTLLDLMNASTSVSSPPNSNSQTSPSSSSGSSIFAQAANKPQDASIFNNRSAFPFVPPEMAAALQFQIFANNPAMIKQKAPPVGALQNPVFSPPFAPPPLSNPSQLAMQKSLDQAQAYEFWLKVLSMNAAMPKLNVKKPGATVKPMRREPHKISPTSLVDSRSDKKGNSIDSLKNESNTSADSADCLQQLLTCAKI